jgi:hypothetical protein
MQIRPTSEEILSRLMNNDARIVIRDLPKYRIETAPLMAEEKELGMALLAITAKYGKFNEDNRGVWAGYEPGQKNDVKSIGVKCENCALYAGGSSCRIIAKVVEPEGMCRFAIIPEGVVEGYMKREHGR